MNNSENVYTHYNIDTNISKNEKIKSKIYKNPKHSNMEYNIINYDHHFVCDNDVKLGVYRSVILSTELEDKDPVLLCFTPPKSLTFDKFVEKNPDINTDIYVNEIIEGTMISLFYDNRNQSWEIASKSAIGGNYWFFRNQYEFDNIKSTKSQPTFRRMFLDAFRQHSSDVDINDIAFLEYLPKEYCYNFVLQHPANHIVINVESPVVYLVSVYQIINTCYEKTALFIAPTIYEKWNCFLNIRGIIEFPNRVQETTYDLLKNTYCSIHSSSNFVGLMITNSETGERTNLENPSYKSLREIRGNHPNLHYQYLCLRRLGKDKILEFVTYFPQYKEIFYKFYKQFGDFVTNLHQSYVSYYIKKKGEQISKQFFPIIYKIHHEIYLPSIQKNDHSDDGSKNNNSKIIVKREIVKKFVENMSPIELIYYINYTNK